jgi:hypothetical protein
MDTKSTALSVAVPIGILAGLAAESVWTASRGRSQSIARAAVVLLLLAGMGIGAYHLPGLIQDNSSYRLRPGDLDAAQWLQSNVPDGARLLVDSVQFPYAPGWIVGVDTGLWIPLLAHRSSLVPPMIYPIEWGDPGVLSNDLRATQEFLARRETGTPPLGSIIDAAGITHFFTGPGAWSLLPAELQGEERLNAVFRQDRLWLFSSRR